MPPSSSNNNNHLEVISDILDKMIELQSANVRNLAEIKSTMAEIESHVKQTNYRFTNGFRSEIKDHVTEEVSQIHSKINDATKFLEGINRSLESLKDFVNSPGTWVKIIIGLIVSVAAATGAVGGCYLTIKKEQSKLTDKVVPPTSSSMHQPAVGQP